MSTPIYNHIDWPAFTWDSDQIIHLLSQLRFQQGILHSQVRNLNDALKSEVLADSLSNEVLYSAQIAGRDLNETKVKSIISEKYIDSGMKYNTDSIDFISGITSLVSEARINFPRQFAAERLAKWKMALTPDDDCDAPEDNWRTGEHTDIFIDTAELQFPALDTDRISHELNHLLNWIADDSFHAPILEAGIAHIWFLAIHPFEKYNGIIARAITDRCLARSEQQAERLYCFSQAVSDSNDEYLDVIHHTLSGDLDITEWLKWFLRCLNNSLSTARNTTFRVLKMDNFFNNYKSVDFNGRQVAAINQLISRSSGKIKTSEWAELNNCSHDTALRDITELIEKGFLRKLKGGGRNTSYKIVLP